MEVDDLELLELVNDYQRRSDEPTFNTLDDIPEALMIEALDEANYIEDTQMKWKIQTGISCGRVDESQYYNFTIEEFEGDDEEYGGEIYGKEEE